MLHLQQLRNFIQVAELGSFSRAAVLLGIAQPALSRQVRQLEVALRVTLLERHGRGVALTEAGKRLVEHGVGLLHMADQTEQSLRAGRDEPLGRVVVAMPPTVGRRLTVALVEAFEQAFPRARLAIVEGLSAHVAEWIDTGRVDLGLLYNPDPQAPLETEPVHREVLHLVGPAEARPITGSIALPVAGLGAGPGAVSKAIPLASPIPLEALPGFPLVIPERSHAIRRLLEARAALAAIQLDVAWEVSSVPAILDLVRNGRGYAVLGPSALTGSAGEGLRARPIGDPPLLNTLFMAASRRRAASPLQRQLQSLLRRLIADGLGDG